LFPVASSVDARNLLSPYLGVSNKNRNADAIISKGRILYSTGDVTIKTTLVSIHVSICGVSYIRNPIRK